ncbi:DUF3325 family protein [Sphingomonas sp. T9W2]|uniref:DUF3325 family protein n=1 Tax=Sphingomonas sp. T9W2 TaxID=3143183 RepID=UPI0031F47C1E
MHGLASFLIVLSLAWCGFALLAFSQQQHWATLRRSRKGPPSLPMRLAATAALALALGLACVCEGSAFGLLLWIGTLTVAAAGTAMLIERLGARNRRG